MSSKVMPPQEMIRNQQQVKMKVLLYWPVYLVVLPTFVYAVITLLPTVNMMLKGESASNIEQLEQQIVNFQAESVKLQNQVQAQKQLIENLRKKANHITLETDGLQAELPVIDTKFISWQAYQKQHPGAKFEDFRKEQVAYLQSQLIEAQKFLNSLK